jgi:hypothetical protein
MGKRFYLIIAALAIFIFNGCKKDTSSDGIPSYIKIEKFDLVDNPDPNLDEGSLSENIVDVWVSINDNENIGGFELPATIPILAEGETKIKLVPGIMLNGISSTRASYPFFTDYEVSVDLVRGEVKNIEPEVMYNSEFTVGFNEEFEFSNTLFKENEYSEASLDVTRETSEVFEGSGSGFVQLTAENDYFKAELDRDIDIPEDGGSLFLEMNYKTDLNIVVGAYLTTSTGVTTIEVAGVRPTDEWKKVYINLTTYLYTSSYPVDKIKPTITVSRAEDYEGEGKVFIDNVKLIYK